MFEPRDRRLFLESLRPPVGYELDCAIGTTFTLDLLTMLTLPVAFTSFEWENEEGQIAQDSLAVLEALRRHAGKITLFCQSGHIAIPKRHKALFGYLEDSVYEVMPPHPNGVFHPKVWVLRYSSPEEPVIYRLLVLSRNLTFDRSWDTMLVLQGEVVDRKNAYARNHPLGDFVAALPSMVVRRSLSDEALADIDKVQGELRKVLFDLPEGFKDISFWPLGITARNRWPFEGRVDRMLIISPFLAKSCLQRLTNKGKDHVLVSRLDGYEKLDLTTMQQFRDMYVLSEEANPEANDMVDEDPANDGIIDNQHNSQGDENAPLADNKELNLTGLHAKVYVADAGWDARIWTGSANATNAAFANNVEFLVELTGSKSKHGVEAIIGVPDENVGFSDLLKTYEPLETAVEQDAEQEKLEAIVEETQRILSRAGFSAEVDIEGESYNLSLNLDSNEPIKIPSEVTIQCWPLSLREIFAKELPLKSITKPIQRQPLLTFGPVSLEVITSFFAFELKAGGSDKQASMRFVLNLPLQGAPQDRRERILKSMLKNKDQFLRYLFFLLSEGGLDTRVSLMSGSASATEAAQGNFIFSELPLFEVLMKALHRNPERLDQIARLVDDLRTSPEGEQLLPEGFMELWDSIWEVRKEVAAANEHAACQA